MKSTKFGEALESTNPATKGFTVELVFILIFEPLNQYFMKGC